MTEETIEFKKRRPFTLRRIKELEINLRFVLLLEPMHDGCHLNSLESAFGEKVDETDASFRWEIASPIAS